MLVSELDSDTGTQYAETLVSQDVGPMGSSNLAAKSLHIRDGIGAENPNETQTITSVIN